MRNKVKTVTEWIYKSENNTIPSDKKIRSIKKYNQNGQIISVTHINHKNDTSEIAIYDYDTNNLEHRHYRYCKDTCLVWYWENQYKNDLLTGWIAVGWDSTIIASTRYEYNNEGRVSAYFHFQLEERSGFMGVYSNDSLVEEIYYEDYEEVYDTTFITYCGDTICYSDRDNYYILLKSPAGFTIENKEYDSYGLRERQTYLYDLNNNLIEKRFFDDDNELYGKYIYNYFDNNLMKSLTYFQTDMDNPATYIEYTYEFY